MTPGIQRTTTRRQKARQARNERLACPLAVVLTFTLAFVFSAWMAQPPTDHTAQEVADGALP